MLTFNKTEKIKIIYDQNKIVLKGESLKLEITLPMSSLLSIYSSGYGEGIGSFAVNLSDEYQKTPVTSNTEVIVPNSIFPPFNSIPEDSKDNKDSQNKHKKNVVVKKENPWNNTKERG